jgi:ribosome-associated toxin RatA of RatAB toxin-antitoxin module
MRHVHRSAIVPYQAADMFALVADIESYPDFLPWCTRAHVERDAQGSNSDPDRQVTARLDLSQVGLTGYFTTRNRLDPPRSISMQLVEGSFSELEGVWEIESLGDDGCKLALTMQFAFSNPMKEMVLGAVFEKSCGQLVDAFVERARIIYGQR